eukprot:903830-Amphidinium_carterae.1
MRSSAASSPAGWSSAACSALPSSMGTSSPRIVAYFECGLDRVVGVVCEISLFSVVVAGCTGSCWASCSDLTGFGRSLAALSSVCLATCNKASNAEDVAKDVAGEGLGT